jgi:hypothetical protein
MLASRAVKHGGNVKNAKFVVEVDQYSEKRQYLDTALTTEQFELY